MKFKNKTPALADRTGYVQAPPNCIQFELVEGCSIACTFCGINGIREKPGNYKFVTEETVIAFCRQLDELHYLSEWNPRIELAMHGEPSMHPDYIGMVALMRQWLPWAHIMMTTNASGLNKKPGPVHNVSALGEVGLNVLAIDCYQHSTKLWYPVLNALQNAKVDFFNYPAQTHANPHRRRRLGEYDIVAIADISVTTAGNHNHLSNHAGAAAPLSEARAGERCANPFRELAVRWDGAVAMCCNDWRGVAKIGNLHNSTLEHIWHHPAMYAWRRALYHGQRDYGPCNGCTHRTFRNGLLPDKYGKDSYPEPDAKDLAAMEAALAGHPYTVPVLRPWE